jgi:endonuclease III
MNPASPAPERLAEIARRLEHRYSDAKYALDWSNPVELLVATILAAQCTDERVNRLTRTLFVKYRSAAAFAAADPAVLEEDVKPAGLHVSKAKAIQGACKALVERFGGRVPRTMEEMLTLPGVGRKTANVVLVTAYQIPSGVIVDTHVKRIAGRLGLSAKSNADDIEQDLMAILPKERWLSWPPAMILHGRETCTAKQPRCEGCVLGDLCPRIGAPP